MAYITADEVKVIRDELKATFPANQGWKFSVRTNHSSEVSVTILSAPVNLTKGHDTKHYHVNHFWLNDHYKDNAPLRAIFNLVNDIVARKHWDKSDVQSDHFNCAYYYNIRVGNYGSDFEYLTPKNIKAKTKWSLRTAQKRFKNQTAVNCLAA